MPTTEERIDLLVADAAAFSAVLRHLVLRAYQNDAVGRRSARDTLCDNLEQMYRLGGFEERAHLALQRALHEVEQAFCDPETA